MSTLMSTLDGLCILWCATIFSLILYMVKKHNKQSQIEKKVQEKKERKKKSFSAGLMTLTFHEDHTQGK